MKRVLLLWICTIILVLGSSLYFLAKTSSRSRGLISPISPHITHSIQKVDISQKTIFVPYWTMTKTLDTSQYDTTIYFGITPDTSGIDKNEDGYKLLSKFILHAKNKKKLLGIRMINADINEKVLQDMMLQGKIITDSVHVAKENGFDGIVLDFEYSGLAFDPLVQSITVLSKNFAIQTHKNNLLFYQTIYGDTFYRVRPFDVPALAQNADGLFIMAYDLHKAGGNPGPNFPLKNDDYDFSEMISTFLKKIPTQKITVIFGMFGYDWRESEKGQSFGVADSLSFLEIQQKFLQKCSFKNCVVMRDSHALEQKITYTDNKGILHEVWFEDAVSVKAKEEFLQKEGIGSVGFWAYTYF